MFGFNEKLCAMQEEIEMLKSRIYYLTKIVHCRHEKVEYAKFSRQGLCSVNHAKVCSECGLVLRNYRNDDDGEWKKEKVKVFLQEADKLSAMIWTPPESNSGEIKNS